MPRVAMDISLYKVGQPAQKLHTSLQMFLPPRCRASTKLCDVRRYLQTGLSAFHLPNLRQDCGKLLSAFMLLQTLASAGLIASLAPIRVAAC